MQMSDRLACIAAAVNDQTVAAGLDVFLLGNLLGSHDELR